MDCLTTAIVRRILARDPAIVLKSMQQCNQCRLFNPEMGSDFGLGQRTGRHRQSKQCPPFRLTQTHRPEPVVQFEPPGAGYAVQKWPNRIDIGGHGWKFVSLLTNSRTVALSMPTPYSILSSKIDSFR